MYADASGVGDSAVSSYRDKYEARCELTAQVLLYEGSTQAGIKQDDARTRAGRIMPTCRSG
eukprot:5737869-Prymnesium_polylepis.1